MNMNYICRSRNKSACGSSLLKKIFNWEDINSIEILCKDLNWLKLTRILQ